MGTLTFGGKGMQRPSSGPTYMAENIIIKGFIANNNELNSLHHMAYSHGHLGNRYRLHGLSSEYEYLHIGTSYLRGWKI